MFIRHPRQPDPHTPGPKSERNLKALLGLDPDPCPTCGRMPEVVAGPGYEWVLDMTHQPGCPNGDVPDVEAVFLEDEDSPALHAEAEAIWNTGEQP